MNVDESMSTLLFAEYMGCEEFWGVGNENKFEQFIELNLPEKYALFKQKLHGIHVHENEEG